MKAENEEKTISIINSLFNALVDNGFYPTTREFRCIVKGRMQKRDNPLEDFLREKTVKKHPSIDTLPITNFMKMTMIVLPVECAEIISIYEKLPENKRELLLVESFECVYPKPCLFKIE